MVGGSTISNTSAAFRSALFTATRALFNQNYDQGANELVWPQFCTLVESTTDTEQYPWLGENPSIKEWLAERQHEGLEGFDYSLKNKNWEATLDIDMNDVEDEKWGMIKLRVSELGYSATYGQDQYVADIVNDAINGGHAYGYCFDGKPMFATNHNWSQASASQSNLRSGSNTGKLDITYGEANIKAAITAFKKFRNSKGRLIGGRPNVLMVSSQDIWDVRRILNSTGMIIATGGTAGSLVTTDRGNLNPLYGSGLTVIENQWLDDGHGVLMQTSGPLRPFIFQMRKRPYFTSQDNENTSAAAFERRVLSYGLAGRWAAGFGPWFKAIAFDGT